MRRLGVLSFIAVAAGFAFISLAGCQQNDAPSTSQKSTSEPADQETAALAAKHENRLAGETSPYLLMHAHNPVNWFPWGDEALQKAKDEGKLIFLSIGYSSCYWCHRMERESFVNPEIAQFLNEHFVCIKVDREERPDVDDVYMTALQVYLQAAGRGGSGGWPLSMFLTPEAKPVVGGTYFPAPQFLGLIQEIQAKWESDPDGFRTAGEFIADYVRRAMSERPEIADENLQASWINDVQQQLAEEYDPEFGGFGYNEANPGMPKFPQPSNLVFLLDRIRRTGDENAKKMLLGTLDHIGQGGIRDHLGGGFHRYSTDRFWRVPHFEKMLYDNAQLASVYSEAYRLTDNPAYRAIVEELLAFAIRELRDSNGGFYSALDAETDEEEGRFYVWTKEELRESLTTDEFQLLAQVYGVDGQPNFEGYYILLLEKPLREVAEELGMDHTELWKQLAPVKSKLFEKRSRRERPLTDTKILTSWNGLMIRGLADAGRILDDEDYIREAIATAEFILENLRTEDGRLLRTFTAGEAKLNAYLDDYAFLVDGLISLHEATGDEKWLHEADNVTTKQIALFWDQERGGFFFTSSDHEELIARAKNPGDGALPSGNSVSAANLLYLAEQLDRPGFEPMAKELVREFAGTFEQSPTSLTRLAVAIAEILDRSAKTDELSSTEG